MSSLYPKRRKEDATDHSAIGRLLTFTDLMALLLCFFIMLYATRDPSVKHMQAFAPNIAPVVVPVAQEEAEAEKTPTLAKPKIGLDLNYIAGLLRQAKERDATLSAMEIAARGSALAVTLPRDDHKALDAALDRIAAYRRTVEIFAPERMLTPLLSRPAAAGMRYFPQNGRDAPLILIH